MTQILIRFLVGGAIVSVFAMLGDVLKPKSFAGLFGAAPSVALATIPLTVAVEGASFAAIEARSMVAGAFAFLLYASLISWLMMRRAEPALLVTVIVMPLWFGICTAAWFIWFR